MAMVMTIVTTLLTLALLTPTSGVRGGDDQRLATLIAGTWPPNKLVIGELNTTASPMDRVKFSIIVKIREFPRPSSRLRRGKVRAAFGKYPLPDSNERSG